MPQIHTRLHRKLLSILCFSLTKRGRHTQVLFNKCVFLSLILYKYCFSLFCFGKPAFRTWFSSIAAVSVDKDVFTLFAWIRKIYNTIQRLVNLFLYFGLMSQKYSVTFHKLIICLIWKNLKLNLCYTITVAEMWHSGKNWNTEIRYTGSINVLLFPTALCPRLYCHYERNYGLKHSIYGPTMVCD